MYIEGFLPIEAVWPFCETVAPFSIALEGMENKPHLQLCSGWFAVSNVATFR